MISEKEVRKYWCDRSYKFGDRAVGFDCKHIELQNTNYLIRKNFLSRYINTSMNTLDYGCGVGRYADFFFHYNGVDLTKCLIDIAKENQPSKDFTLLKEPFLCQDTVNKLSKIEQVFTATVLQHCDHDLVYKIIRSFKLLDNVVYLNFYEKNNDDYKPHVTSRTTKCYSDIVKTCGFDIFSEGSYTHMIHGENHTLSVFKVR